MVDRQVNLTELRKRAEEALRRSRLRIADVPGDPSETELRHLMEELRIYQTELESQNQELSNTQSALAQALEKSQALFADLPLAGIIVDSLGFIVDANNQARELLGLRPALPMQRRSALQLFDSDSRGRFYEVLRDRSSPIPQCVQLLDVQIASGDLLPCDVHLIQLPGESQEDDRTVVVLVDQSTEIALRNLEVVAERRRAEEVLRASEERWQFALEGAGDGVWDVDLKSREAHFSRRYEEILGYAEGEFRGTCRDWLGPVHPQDQSRVEAALQDYVGGRSNYLAIEYRLRRRDGNYRWISARGMTVRRFADGKPLRVVGTISDITQRKQAEEQLRIAAVAFESPEGILITDVDGIILRFNNALAMMTGYSLEETVGRSCRLLIADRDNTDSFDAMWESVKRTGSWSGEIAKRRKNGESFPGRITVTAVTGETGEITHYVVTCTDITFRKAAEDEIRQLAFYDPLTQLPNRRLMRDRLNQAIASAARRGRRGALMVIDLDNFKALNDTLGHAVGDQFLVEVALRLESSIRRGDTAARLGGDEFVVILEDLDESAAAAAQAEAVAVKIQTRLSQPFQLDVPAVEDATSRRTYRCTSSIGITMFCDHSVAVDDLMQHADTAMYQAKLAGRNTLRFFDPEMQAAARLRAILEDDLRKGISEAQFLLHFQPQVDAGGRVIGAEALVRWQHPERGLVSPAQFIPVAEESGLILPIGNWVIDAACRMLASWAKKPELSDLTLAVNISARQFSLPNIVEQVLTLIEQAGAPPGKLKLELTESLLLDNAEESIAKMNALKARGVGFSMDDFGTGYSSLSYLKRLPLDQLKIDQSFVRHVLSDANDAAIARTVVALARTLGLAVIAEGVETKAQRDFLSSAGCHVYQGYYYSRPVPLDRFEAFVHGSYAGMTDSVH